MRVIELDQAGGLLTRAVQVVRAAEAARTGLHVSTIVNDYMRMLQPGKFEKFDRDTKEEERLGFQEVGNVVEDIIATGLRERIPGWTKPLPQTYRGITGSPDGWRGRTKTIDEIKATWVSEGDFLDSLKYQIYVKQALAYAEMWGADRIVLSVLFVNGLYPKGKPCPHPRTFRLLFTPRERFECFEGLVQHAIDRELPGYESLTPRRWKAA